MRDTQIRWEHIKAARKGRRLFTVYCDLNSCCEECNKKVRFLCKVKERLTACQDKIIRKSLDKKQAVIENHASE